MYPKITVTLNHRTGWSELRFRYHEGLIDLLKKFPGPRWESSDRCWIVPNDLLSILSRHTQLELDSTIPPNPPPIYEGLAELLRPYQVEALQFLLLRSGALLTLDMRLGKSAVASIALASMLGHKRAQLAILIYPNSVAGVWQDQLKKWINSPIYQLESFDPLPLEEIERLRWTPYCIIGCHYEILSKRIEDLEKLTQGNKFVLVADECHRLQNSKAGHTAVAMKLAKNRNCIARWGLTGTPMRNKPKNVATLFDFANPGSMGFGIKKFAERYCDRQLAEFGFHYEKDPITKELVQVPGHWDDNGRSNEDELSERLAYISYRKMRSEVASHLPKSDRNVIFCDVPKSILAKYHTAESAVAHKLKPALEGEYASFQSRDALKKLVQITSQGKIKTAIDRINLHVERQVKIVVFSHHHETAQKILEASTKEFTPESSTTSIFWCGGWLTQERRTKAIEAWKQAVAPSILIANTLSSGVGIDLADAEVAIFVELEWVPADFRQGEDRIQDVHLGKCLTPRIFEYLIVKNTIDESMANALLTKIRAIESIVGSDAETRGVSSALGGAGVVDPSRLGLENTDQSTVEAALLSIRDRWLNNERADGLDKSEVHAIRNSIVAEASILEDENDEDERSDHSQSD